MQAEAAPPEALVTASLRRRFLALLVDLVVFAPIDFIGFVILPESVVFSWASLGLLACYSIVFTTAAGGTPGKLLLGIYVGDKEGQRIGMQRSIVRHLAVSLFYLDLVLTLAFPLVPALFLRFFWVLFWLGFVVSFLMALFDPQRRALHDRIAGTRVLRGKAPTRR